jgi:hypothetical protein
VNKGIKKGQGVVAPALFLQTDESLAATVARVDQRGMRRWRCGSEDYQHEHLKPQYGGTDRHEP